MNSTENTSAHYIVRSTTRSTGRRTYIAHGTGRVWTGKRDKAAKFTTREEAEIEAADCTRWLPAEGKGQSVKVLSVTE